MKTSELKGAWLDYWVCVAEGLPHYRLEIRPVPRTDLFICVLKEHGANLIKREPVKAMPYSSDWTLAGALLDKYGIIPESGGDNGKVMGAIWYSHEACWLHVEGDNAREAICRAVVKLKMGDEVGNINPVPEN